jgi:hypothetical protein
MLYHDQSVLAVSTKAPVYPEKAHRPTFVLDPRNVINIMVSGNKQARVLNMCIYMNACMYSVFFFSLSRKFSTQRNVSRGLGIT